MTTATNKIKSFTDLQAWQVGHSIVLMVYEETRNFPRDEVFVLVSQMRRSAVSITSNIAEGFSRNSSKDKINFFVIAHGSVTELQNQLIIARDVGYITPSSWLKISENLVQVHKLISGLIKYLRNNVRST